MAYKTRADLLAEIERLEAEIVYLRSGIQGMTRDEAHQLRMEAIEARGRVGRAEQAERFARADAERARLAAAGLGRALMAMIDVDVLGDHIRPEQAARP